jgi:hypothetical protein
MAAPSAKNPKLYDSYGDELWKQWELLDLFSDLLHLAK